MFDGNKQQLRLISWDALPRVDQTITHEWKPDTWYTFKLTVQPQGDKALVRGKVWPKDDKEPDKWTLEFDDPLPNREGSPALYGNATGIGGDNAPGAEVHYNNVKVTLNQK
jgi:outer membrane protein assembly factor BamB